MSNYTDMVKQLTQQLAQRVCDQRIEDRFDEQLKDFTRTQAFTLGLMLGNGVIESLNEHQTKHCAGVLSTLVGLKDAEGKMYIPSNWESQTPPKHIDQIEPFIIDADDNGRVRIYSSYALKTDLDNAKEALAEVGIYLRWNSKGKYWYTNWEHTNEVIEELQKVVIPDLSILFVMPFERPPKNEALNDKNNAIVTVVTDYDKNRTPYWRLTFKGPGVFENKDKFLDFMSELGAKYRKKCKYNKAKKQWLCFSPIGPAVIAKLFDHELIKMDDVAWQTARDNEELNKILKELQQRQLEQQEVLDTVTEGVEEWMNNLKLPEPFVLYDYQHKDVTAALKGERLGFGHEQGLGKGVMGAVLAKYYAEVAGWHVFIIVPAGMVSIWEHRCREFIDANQHFIHITSQNYRSMPQVEYKVKDSRKTKQMAWHNYQRRRYHDQWGKNILREKAHHRTNVWRVWVRQTDEFVTMDDKYVIITDESHKFGEMDSYQTGVWLELTRHATRVHPMSGTVFGKGVPYKLAPTLMHLGSPLVTNANWDDKTWGFYKRFCDLQRKHIGGGRTVIDKSGVGTPQTQQELHEELQRLFIRRREIDYLDIPPHRRIITQVPKVSKNEVAKYEQALQAAWERYQERVQSGEAKPGSEQLVLIGHQRKACSLAKVDYTAEKAVELIEQGEDALVIFVAFQDTVQKLAATIRSKLSKAHQKATIHKISGSMKVTEDDSPTGFSHRSTYDIQTSFNEDAGNQVLIVTLGAGAEGLNLTRAKYMITHDMPWGADTFLQAQKRIWRNKQTRRTFNIIPVWDYFDYSVAMGVAERARVMGNIIDGFDQDLERLQVFDGAPEVIGQYSPQHQKELLTIIERQAQRGEEHNE